MDRVDLGLSKLREVLKIEFIGTLEFNVENIRNALGV